MEETKTARHWIKSKEPEGDHTMNILFAAPENAWGGFLGLVRERLPEHRFTATGAFCIERLSGVDVLIPTMCPVSRAVLADADRLKLIQQCGAGLEGVDIAAAAEKQIAVANRQCRIGGRTGHLTDDRPALGCPRNAAEYALG